MLSGLELTISKLCNSNVIITTVETVTRRLKLLYAIHKSVAMKHYKNIFTFSLAIFPCKLFMFVISIIMYDDGWKP